MKPWIIKLFSQPGYIYIDFIYVPGLRVAKLGEQPHTPTLYPINPVLEINGACILQFLVSRPRPNGPFVKFLMNIDKSRVSNSPGHSIEGVAAPTGALTATQHVRIPVIQDVVRGQAAIISLNDGTDLQLLNPPTRAKFPSAELSDAIPDIN